VADDSCYTVLHPTGPLGSFNTADAGANVSFVGPEGYGYDIPRNPQEYPPDRQDVWTYYLAINGYQAEPSYVYTLPEGAGDSPSDLQKVIARKGNYPFGEEVALEFGGGVAPARSPISSIPRPSSSVENPPTITLPHREEALLLAWNGVRYKETGELMTADDYDTKAVPSQCSKDKKENEELPTESTCMGFLAPAAEPGCPEDCIGAKPAGSDGQIYTGPWDTSDKKVTFKWKVPETTSPGEYVSLSVRFLGPVDRETNDYLRVRMTNYEEPENLAGGRAALACENDEDYTDFVFDPQYYADYRSSEIPTATQDLIPALHGDPSNNVAEVTCRLADDGEFVLEESFLKDALKEAEVSGAEGAVFFFSRNTSVAAEVPDAMDIYFQRRPISPVRVNTRSVEIGRFWYGAATSTEEK
jgi:hypothetical protein